MDWLSFYNRALRNNDRARNWHRLICSASAFEAAKESLKNLVNIDRACDELALEGEFEIT